MQVNSQDADVLRQLLFSYIKSRTVIEQRMLQTPAKVAKGTPAKEKAAKRKPMGEKTPQKVCYSCAMKLLQPHSDCHICLHRKCQSMVRNEDFTLEPDNNTKSAKRKPTGETTPQR